MHVQNIKHAAKPKLRVVLMAVALSICLILANKVIAKSYNIGNRSEFWAYFVDFSHKRPPLISDHFLMHQGWSLRNI